jgi:hypothetical protein
MVFLKSFASIILATIVLVQCNEKKQNYSYNKFRNTTPAPGFSVGREWVNVKSPLELNDLKGKISILYFCAFSNIDCISVVSDLKVLEEKWNKELLVIGVHSPKYPAEDTISNLKHSVYKHNIQHPIISDGNYFLWKSYGIRAWPTLIVLDPDTHVSAKYTGENFSESLDDLITDLVKEFDLQGKIKREPISQLSIEKDRYPETLLSYPGKILIEEKDLWILDTANHRVLQVEIESGIIKRIIGTGKPGLANGNFNNSQFFYPQGMLFHLGDLYISDTYNHCIRKIDLKNSLVTTIAGTGNKTIEPILRGTASTTPLKYPIDLAILDGKFYITNAGTNQILKLDMQESVIDVFLGKGVRGLKDGSLENAELAQPMGITGSKEVFFFSDANNNAIRRVEINYSGKIETLLGKGYFQFGDVDGPIAQAKIQYPVGMYLENQENSSSQVPNQSICKDGLVVADSFNHKIKCISFSGKNIFTILGQGKAGYKNGKKHEVLFNYPTSIAIQDNKLFISDTNNHAIRIYDSKTGDTKTLSIRFGLDTKMIQDSNQFYKEEVLEIPQQVFSIGSENISFELDIPKEFLWDKENPAIITFSSSNPESVFSKEKESKKLENFFGKWETPVSLKVGESNLEWNLLAYYRDEKKTSVSIIKKLKIKTKIKIRSDGKLYPKYKMALSMKSLL